MDRVLLCKFWGWTCKEKKRKGKDSCSLAWRLLLWGRLVTVSQRPQGLFWETNLLLLYIDNWCQLACCVSGLHATCESMPGQMSLLRPFAWRVSQLPNPDHRETLQDKTWLKLFEPQVPRNSNSWLKLSSLSPVQMPWFVLFHLPSGCRICSLLLSPFSFKWLGDRKFIILNFCLKEHIDSFLKK